MNTKEIMIEMRDGARLQSFIYLPSGEGPFPSLLARCMYGADRMRDHAEFYRAKGVRGSPAECPRPSWF